MKNVRKQEDNDMVQHVVEEIMQEDKYKKISSKNDTSYYHEHENIKYGINE